MGEVGRVGREAENIHLQPAGGSGAAALCLGKATGVYSHNICTLRSLFLDAFNGSMRIYNI